MIRKTQNALEWLFFEHLSEFKNLIHATFLRKGGVSSGAYDSLNFGFSLDDDSKNVEENIRRAQRALGLDQLLSLRQEHDVKIVEAEFVSGITDGDALMTDEKNTGLMIKHADCQAAIFYDPMHHAVANVHCGWRGNVKNIYREIVKAMGRHYGTRPEDLLVGISPSLGPQASEFRNYTKELPAEFWVFQIKPTYFDLWEISRQQLLASGILPHHIEMAKICTFSNPTDCFSYRREKRSGRHATIVALL